MVNTTIQFNLPGESTGKHHRGPAPHQICSQCPVPTSRDSRLLGKKLLPSILPLYHKVPARVLAETLGLIDRDLFRVNESALS